MTDEMLMRLGFYLGSASRLLGDESYAGRFLGHAETITDEQYYETVGEINARLTAAGHIQPDEDLFESALAKLTTEN